MRTLRQTLRLQHHRHTGRLLHHRHTSYRALAVIFLIAGICMGGLSLVNQVAADTFGVAAIVNVPVPTTPPIVFSPSAESTLSGSSALVTGSCPLVTPQALVRVSLDGNPVGTSACDSRNDFSLPVTISSGSHQLVATILTITGQVGPSSSPVLLTDSSVSPASNITIAADQQFVYAGAKTVTWSGTVTDAGSKTTYVHIDWGDNTQSNYTKQSGTQSFTHSYGTLTSHNILLAVSDRVGNSTTEQFAAPTFATYVAMTPASNTMQVSLLTPTTAGLYGLYLTALSVTCIVWLEAKHAAHNQHAAV